MKIKNYRSMCFTIHINIKKSICQKTYLFISQNHSWHPVHRGENNPKNWKITGIY